MLCRIYNNMKYNNNNSNNDNTNNIKLNMTVILTSGNLDLS